VEKHRVSKYYGMSNHEVRIKLDAFLFLTGLFNIDSIKSPDKFVRAFYGNQNNI